MITVTVERCASLKVVQERATEQIFRMAQNPNNWYICKVDLDEEHGGNYIDMSGEVTFRYISS